MMKKVISAILAALLLLSLIACGAKDPWQEQYDLGMRYLNEGNYQEAVIAFEAAIEIDAKRPEAYLGAADAYVGLGDYASARSILEDGLTNTEAPEIREKLDEPAEPGSLQLSGVSYAYGAGGSTAENNPGAVGTLYIDFTVEGPANVVDAYIATWYDEMPSQLSVDAGIQRVVAVWREAGTGNGNNSLPFTCGQGRPVDPDELGKTQYVMLLGLDANGDAAAYALIPVDIPAEYTLS